ncbi:hypothetical protein B0H11DRAFT_2258751 [Mycena galericulata]|nr:hypothetical protein B0H11DRAFT_2262992 [Mycena galericulata]KAJ7434012.1 hypothetical protein B0H11DRAFT_2258751 [Mycena galericulata]
MPVADRGSNSSARQSPLTAFLRPAAAPARLFDIGFTDDDGYMVFFTASELARCKAELEALPNDSTCSDCHRRVATLGWAEFSPFLGGISRDYDVCKACWAYHKSNLYAVTDVPAPPCTCPADAVACANVDSGCALHIVPAMEAVPRDIPRVLVAPRTTTEVFRGMTGGLSLLDIAICAYRASKASKDSQCPIVRWRNNSTDPDAASCTPRLPYGTPSAGEQRRRQSRELEKKKERELARSRT